LSLTIYLPTAARQNAASQVDNVERLGQKHHTNADGIHQLPI